jgi:hypothetical protein
MIQTVAELVNHLAGLPPMMPVMGWNEDTNVPKFINMVEIDDSDTQPVLRISMSEYPQDFKIKMAQSYDEELAEQKEKAMAMARESKKAQDGV